MANRLLDEVVAAHGGLDRWSRVNRLTIDVRIGGRLFAVKFASSALRSLTVAIDPRRIHAILRPFPAVGLTGEFNERAVTIRRDDGQVISRREIVRGSDGRVHQTLHWDNLD